MRFPPHLGASAARCLIDREKAGRRFPRGPASSWRVAPQYLDEACNDATLARSPRGVWAGHRSEGDTGAELSTASHRAGGIALDNPGTGLPLRPSQPVAGIVGQDPPPARCGS